MHRHARMQGHPTPVVAHADAHAVKAPTVKQQQQHHLTGSKGRITVKGSDLDHKPIQVLSTTIFSSSDVGGPPSTIFTSTPSAPSAPEADSSFAKLAADMFNPPPVPPPEAPVDVPDDPFTTIMTETLSSLSKHPNTPLETASLPSVLTVAKAEMSAAQEARVQALSPSMLVAKLRKAGMGAQAASLAHALAQQPHAPEGDSLVEELMPPVHHHPAAKAASGTSQGDLVRRLRAAGMDGEADHIEALMQVTGPN